MWMGVMWMFGGISKNFCYLWVCFFMNLKMASKKCSRLPCFTLLLKQRLKRHVFFRGLKNFWYYEYWTGKWKYFLRRLAKNCPLFWVFGSNLMSDFRPFSWSVVPSTAGLFILWIAPCVMFLTKLLKISIFFLI